MLATLTQDIDAVQCLFKAVLLPDAVVIQIAPEEAAKFSGPLKWDDVPVSSTPLKI